MHLAEVALSGAGADRARRRGSFTERTVVGSSLQKGSPLRACTVRGSPRCPCSAVVVIVSIAFWRSAERPVAGSVDITAAFVTSSGKGKRKLCPQLKRGATRCPRFDAIKYKDMS